MNERVNIIQNFYSRVICDNKGDVKKMFKVIYVILKYYSSIFEESKYNDCF